MKTLRLGFILIAIAIIFVGCKEDNKIERPNPTKISYRDVIDKTSRYVVYRTCEYKLTKVNYDTVFNVTVGSSIEPPKLKRRSPRIDLNKIFGKKDVDWNYIELDENKLRYLDSIGIYWDSKHGYYRK